MKLRVMALMMAMLLLPMVSYAEKEYQKEFSFRNGIGWSSAVEEVIASETEEYASCNEYDEFSELSYEYMPVLFYEADLQYFFYQGKLIAAGYYFNDMTPRDNDFLLNTVSSKYGPPIEQDSSRLENLMYIMSGTRSTPVLMANWEVEDGTFIAVYNWSEATDQLYVLYILEDAVLAIGDME